MSSQSIHKFSISFVYIFFGTLKLLERGAADTLVKETLYFLNPDLALFLVGLMEVCIGIFILVPRFEKIVSYIALAHLIGTISPFILVPGLCFQENSWIPNLTGQYIIKNVMIMSILIDIIRYKKPKVNQSEDISEDDQKMAA